MATITAHFKQLGYPLRNQTWSWGGQNLRGDSILFRAWSDETDWKRRTVMLLEPESLYEGTISNGVNERQGHLARLWEGSASGYVVMVNPKNPHGEGPRAIQNYRDDVVFPLLKLVSEAGHIYGVLAPPIPINQLSVHRQSFRTEAGGTELPERLVFKERVREPAVIGQKEERKPLPYIAAKGPAMRQRLIAIAATNSKIFYGDLMREFGIGRGHIGQALSLLGHESRNNDEPIITALVVLKGTGRCSSGILDEFKVSDDEAERQALYKYWGAKAQEISLKERARRFAIREERPDQQRFREAVFEACGGKCAISQCNIDDALDAAHLRGRNWREGHNNASDGLLMRKDLHALYDKGVLAIDERGVVSLTVEYYKQFNGIVVERIAVRAAG